ncbi:hypothetical protein BST61_g10775 [Cercospora zeina]
MDDRAQCPNSQDVGESQDACQPQQDSLNIPPACQPQQDSLNIPPACISQPSQNPTAACSIPLEPADGVSYTTSELTTFLTSLETRLTGFAEALLGVGECLDSLQLQIKELRDRRDKEAGDRADGSESDSGSEAEAKKEGEQVGEGQYEAPDGQALGTNGGADTSEEERKGGDETGLGDMISGFVFGDDDESGDVLQK